MTPLVLGVQGIVDSLDAYVPLWWQTSANASTLNRLPQPEKCHHAESIYLNHMYFVLTETKNKDMISNHIKQVGKVRKENVRTNYGRKSINIKKKSKI